MSTANDEADLEDESWLNVRRSQLDHARRCGQWRASVCWDDEAEEQGQNQHQTPHR